MPSGESLARQVLLGQMYFQDRFGFYCDLMWLPDSFGYSGALPQIVSLGGMDRFLTQKISWNDTNTLPHHSFWWEGIDGTRILTHFPPSDTYNADVTATELHRAAANYREKAISDNSILLFGYGDGGGGPTREMVARAERFQNLEGVAQVHMRGPREFFDRLGEELAGADSSWVGELYLELHRGTFTSQTRTKAGNRRNESLIRQVEAACTHAALLGDTYPKEELTRILQHMLLGQFHDILPGTSIKWVHDEVEARHAQAESELRALLERAADYIQQHTPPGVPGRVNAPARTADAEASEISCSKVGSEYVLESEHLRVVINGNGLVRSFWDKKRSREVVPEGSLLGELAIYQDEPVMWDAWDIEKTAFDTEQKISACDSVTQTDDRIIVARRFGDSAAVASYELTPDGKGLEIELNVDWHEEEKLLKLLFPLALHANHARYETQFGYVERAIHENTSWDAARYEVVAHRYLHVLEGDFGVGLVNDATYGYSVGKPTGGTALIGTSVLKSANFPDQQADRGSHTRRWALIPTADTAKVLDQAEAINQVAADCVSPLAQVTDPRGAVRISAIKQAEDGSGDVIVRLYEALGGRAEATLTLADVFENFDAREVDLLEDPLDRTSFDGTFPCLACGAPLP